MDQFYFLKTLNRLVLRPFLLLNLTSSSPIPLIAERNNFEQYKDVDVFLGLEINYDDLRTDDTASAYKGID